MVFSWVDWAILAIIAVSAVISLKRGFVKEALSLLTWIIAGIVAWMFGGALAQHLTDYIETPSMRVFRKPDQSWATTPFRVAATSSKS